MSLFTQNSGDFLPQLRWRATKEKWVLVKDGAETAFDFGSAIIDLENLELGHLYIAPGAYDRKEFQHYTKGFPSIENVKIEGKDGREVNKYKEAFSVKVLLGKEFDDRLHIYETNQQSSKDAIDALMEVYLKEKDANAGKVPVVGCTGVVSIKNDFGGEKTVPQFVITAWVDRPAELDAGSSDNVSELPSATATAEAPVQKVAVSEF